MEERVKEIDKEVVTHIDYEIKQLFLEFTDGVNDYITEDSLNRALMSAGVSWDRREIR